jgi:hypothetical protein
MLSTLRALGAFLVVAGLAAWGLAALSGGERTSPLVDVAAGELSVMDFRAPFALEPLPPGWWHRKFFTRAPMTLSLASKDGVPAMRLETNVTASMLLRFTDVDLAALFREIWKDQGAARIEEIALFCDTDETKTRSVAYFADVRLKRRG